MICSCLYTAADNGLIEVKGSTFKLVLTDIVTFTTGMPVEPPLGFSPQPSLNFISTSSFPIANTCANILNVPLEHTCYDEFVWHMCFGLLNSAGFGLI